MKTLEEEAADYAENVSNLVPGPYIDFIAGANSKWVESEKIKAQIDALSDIRNSETIFWVDSKIEELEQQLKQFEDE